MYKRSFSTTPGPPKIMRNDEKQWRGGGVGQDRSFHHTKLVPISRFGPVVSVRKKEVWKHTLGSAVAFLAISSEPNHIKPVFSKVPPKSLFCPSNSVYSPPQTIVLSPQIPGHKFAVGGPQLIFRGGSSGLFQFKGQIFQAKYLKANSKLWI